MKSKCIALGILLLSTGPVLLSEETLRPQRLSKGPKIDGILDDSVWSGVPRVTGFNTFIPDFGTRVAEQTEVAMAYDEENLYFGVHCIETDREKIKTSVTSRDNNLDDDWFCLNLDSFNDQQGLYAFYINPAGIQSDSRFSAGREDFSLDYVWFSSGSMDSAGYSLEIQIPLKSIRYADGDTAMMAVIFERYISRRSEHSSFPALDPVKGISSFATQMNPIAYPGIKHYMLLELLPAFTFSQNFVRPEGELVKDDQRGEFSLTGKYGITSNLILDATYNPDFSQVESDAGQVDVNLRYDLFFSEKRPFFLEGRDNFVVAATQMSNYRNIDPVISLVHTRTIIDPLLGAKITGKLSDRSSIATLYAMDELPEPERPESGHFSHYPIARYKLALSDDSYVGALFAGQEFEDHTNNIFGLDNQQRVSPASVLGTSAFLSQYSQGSTTEYGHTVGIQYSFDDRDMSAGLAFREVSDNFRADMGYITRTGIAALSGFLRPKYFPTSTLVQRISPEVYSAQTFDQFSNMWETYNHLLFSALFRGNLSFTARAVYATEIYEATSFQTSAYVLSAGGQVLRPLSVSFRYQNGKAIYYDSLQQGKSRTFDVSMLYQPSEKIRAEGSFVFSEFFRDSDGEKIYEYPISRLNLVFQFNRYLFFRGIGEFNRYYRQITTDFLASFTYIPGTVFFVGYGSLYDKLEWNGAQTVPGTSFRESQRGFFLKASYLWRV